MREKPIGRVAGNVLFQGMITKYPFTHHSLALLAALLLPQLAAAQTTPEAPLPRPAGVVRLDLLNPLAQSIALGQAPNGPVYHGFSFPLPLLLGYERPLGQRFSYGAELQLNLGDSYQRESGLNLPLRYYFGQRQRAAHLLGGYLAPFATARLKQERKTDDYYYQEIKRRMVGGGLLVGYQFALRRALRLDVAAGIAVAVPQFSSYRVSYEYLPWAYPGGTPTAIGDERYGGTFEGRISIGYSF